MNGSNKEQLKGSNKASEMLLRHDLEISELRILATAKAIVVPEGKAIMWDNKLELNIKQITELKKDIGFVVGLWEELKEQFEEHLHGKYTLRGVLRDCIDFSNLLLELFFEKDIIDKEDHERIYEEIKRMKKKLSEGEKTIKKYICPECSGMMKYIRKFKDQDETNIHELKCSKCEKKIWTEYPNSFLGTDSKPSLAGSARQTDIYSIRTLHKDGHFEDHDPKDLKPAPIFRTAGVFLKDDDFILVHPFKKGLTVIGENNIQYEYIERIKEKGIDFDGNLTESFYKILQIDGIREDIRVGIFGFASIHPFFYALSKALDIFPNLFVIGIHGSGKTTLTETLFNHLYGTKIRSPDSINSPARIIRYSTESTFSLNFDDVDILDPKLMNFIKTSSTQKGTRDRLTREQKIISEQTYTSYIGTANNRNFLSGNENDAFRKRCLIFETMEEIDIKEDFTSFESNRSDIAEGKIYGFFLIEKAMEFFNTLSTKDISTYFKLTAHINEIKRKIKERIIEKVIPLSDARRLTIYALIYIGWEIWNYIFKKAELEPNILDKYLDFNQDHFLNFIKNLEETEIKF